MGAKGRGRIRNGWTAISGEKMGMSGRRARRTRESHKWGNSGSTLRSRGKAGEEKFQDGVRMSVGNSMGGAGIFRGDVGKGSRVSDRRESEGRLTA